MRKPFLTRIVLVAAAVITAVLLVPGRSAPPRTWPEVIFLGTTNSAGTNVAFFRIVNHGPASGMLWLPPRLRIGTDFGVEIKSFTGRLLDVGESITTTVACPDESVKWQAGFLYDYEGWRRTVERWAGDIEQQWAWSQWVEP